MTSPAVVEQQAKLGVSAEESKASRLKRQQARFRDRGGVFVPSSSNPLVNILLARTVSGESPSRARLKGVPAKRLSLSKIRQASPARRAGAATVAEERRAVAGNSKSKPPPSRKRKAKAAELEDVVATKPVLNRSRKSTKSRKKAPGSDTEQPLPTINPKTKSTAKTKGRQHLTVPSTSNPATKTKLLAKANSKPAKEVVEVLDSDDDQTLVDVLRTVKSNSKKNARHKDVDENDDDAPIVRKRPIPHEDDAKTSGPKTTASVKKERSAGILKKTAEGKKKRTQDKKSSKANAKKHLVYSSDGDDDVPSPPSEEGKIANSTSINPQSIIVPASRMVEDVKNRRNLKSTDKGKGKGRVQPEQDNVELVERDGDERPPERVSKPKKRKKEDDNDDDRPRKTVKFSETIPSHSSSRNLKENQPDRKHKSADKSSVKDEPDGSRLKPATKPPSRVEARKGPPREVLERIKASAALHLRCADGEPDELDCLS